MTTIRTPVGPTVSMQPGFPMQASSRADESVVDERSLSQREAAVDALEGFFSDVQSGEFPGPDETYTMDEESADLLREMSEGGYAGLAADDLMADEAMER